MSLLCNHRVPPFQYDILFHKETLCWLIYVHKSVCKLHLQKLKERNNVSAAYYLEGSFAANFVDTAQQFIYYL